MVNETINDRVKSLRIALEMTQIEFGNIIESSQNYLSQIESGNRPVTSKIEKIICLQSWNGKIVNKEWLSNGTGSMFLEIDKGDELSVYVTELLEEPNNELYILIQEIIHTYMEVSPEGKKLFREISKKLIENLKSREG